MAKLKGRAKEFADADAPVAKGFDPEDDAPAEETEDGESEDSDDGLAGTEHYDEVGKSKLRQADEIGPQYAGSRISREALYNDDDDQGGSDSDEEDEDQESTAATQFADPGNFDMDVDVEQEDGDIDSDAAFDETDIERFKDFTFRGSSQHATTTSRKRPTASDFMSDSEGEGSEEGSGTDTDEDILDVDEQHSEDLEGGSETSKNNDEKSEEESGDEDGESAPSEAEESDDESEAGSDGDREKTRRAELRKIMNEEQSTVVATISQAAKADADKGNAVKQQRNAFDSLLTVRMALQKGLIATNTLNITDNDTEDTTGEPYQAAEDAALKLWNTLDSMRHELIQTHTPPQTGQKRKRSPPASTSTPSSTLWARMQAAEAASLPTRHQTLEKWWGKVKGAAPPTAGKLITAAPTQTITSALQEHLAKPGLVDGVHRPRSCAPAQEKRKVVTDPHVYDDSTLYKQLLNQLVEQRKSDARPVGGAAQWVVKEAKTRREVDTKASKGRKMRFTVHEKLQNFMAPEPRGSWEEAAVERFFGTLLGRRMTLGEEGGDAGEDEGDDEEAGLMLFRSRT